MSSNHRWIMMSLDTSASEVEWAEREPRCGGGDMDCVGRLSCVSGHNGWK